LPADVPIVAAVRERLAGHRLAERE
jgi:hypothetical protein